MVPTVNSKRGFDVLLKMSSNPEVLGFILRGLLAHISKLLKLLQQRNDQQLHRDMAALLHKLLKVSTRWAKSSDCRYLFVPLGKVI